MFAGFKHHVRYWGFLLLKFVGAGLLSLAALWFLNRAFEPHPRMQRLGFDLLYTTLALVWFQFTCGLFYLAVWDQRYRCRTCLRRLCMPIETGSWGYMLQLGRPRIEYICPYGHGKLNVEELQISGKVAPEWTEQGDIWQELFASSDKSDGER
jgi:hypothetical protein